MSLVFGVHPHVVPPAGAVVIKAVRAYVVGTKELEERSGGGADCHRQVRARETGPRAVVRPRIRGRARAQAEGHWIVDTPISNPMSVYEEYKTSRSSWGIGALGTVVCEVETTTGVIGVGISSAWAATGVAARNRSCRPLARNRSCRPLARSWRRARVLHH